MSLHGWTPRGRSSSDNDSAFAYAGLGFVNIFGWQGKVWLGVTGVMFDAPAQMPAKWGFTISTPTFSIFEQSPKKPPRVPAR
ncbi:hypothetical protein GR232_36085 [Rhizobium leguminosarum]|uniref:hypothetical protein n=1 Tax=Rhizobium ruizarguesonis TaxID=2081791 RepID=UPI0013BDEE60|nr:hypothetical protein [Rhizobium ruizarguesonis]NEI32210.1 hypothetical protein [Rhizobium ruizarguesonis]